MRIKLKRNTLYILLLLFFSFKGFAENSIIVENLNEKYNRGKNQVNCMFQDSIGFIWFGMANGLYKFDNISINYIETPEVNGLNHPDVRTITEYAPGMLLLGTYDYGLLKYNTISEKMDTLSFKSNFSFSNTKINKIIVGNDGIIWVATRSGFYKIRSVDNATNNFELLQFYTLDNSELNSNEIIDIMKSKNGDIWVLTMSQIGKINTETNSLKTAYVFEANTSFTFLDENRILLSCYGVGLKVFDTEKFALMNTQWRFGNDIRARYIYKDNNEKLWLSISNVGLYLLDYNKDLNIDLNKSMLISNSSEPFNTLNSNVIFFIGQSRDGSIFVCSEAGINKIIQKNNFFHSYTSNFKNEQGFSYGIRSIYKIDKNNLLVGTMGAGLKRLSLSSGELCDIILQPGNDPFAKNIQSIIRDNQGNYWIGTEGYGVVKILTEKNNLCTKPNFINYNAYINPFPKKTLLNDFVMCLLEDKRNNMWIGTWYGLSLISSNERNKTDQYQVEIVNYLNKTGEQSSISSNTILCLLQDKDGNVWAGTQNGINKIIKNNDQYYFNSNIKDKYGNLLNAKAILSMYQSNKGEIWFSTHDGGLCLLDADNMLFEEFNSKNGFIDYVINSIQEDDYGKLWMGTSDGICRYDPISLSYKLYKKEECLNTNLFLLNASCKVDDKLVFGSDKGIIYFAPENIKETFYEKNLVLTDIKLFNKSIQSNQQNSLLKRNISFTKEIDLEYNQNYITFEFSSLNFKRESDIQYSCKLEGLETEWNDIGDENKITYTNLTHGGYVFKVKAYDAGLHTNFEEVSLKVKINPPYWKTTIAYILYYVMLAFSLYKLYTYFLDQEKRKSALALERLDSKKKHEIDLMKLRFFMNVSHEFRTPLTLLSAPLDTLMKDDANKEKRKTYYQLMHQNVQRLKRLIDELLELRKIDAGFLKMEWKLGNIVDFTKQIFDTFQNYAEKRNMKFTFTTNITELNIYFDADKLDKVLFNIISNAFKFTENDGTIEIMINIHSSAFAPEPNKSNIEILVKDSGAGISKDALNNIFQRFHSIENNRPIDSASTGIGLSLAKELVELHNGKIEVESVENQGSIFRILIPVYDRNPHEVEIGNELVKNELENDELNKTSVVLKNIEHDKGKSTKPLLQIVEDNDDLRIFLASELSDQYEIIQCINGEEGLTIAKARIPDLIISDIMMDKMDGISMCKKIKSDEKTSHIPIILLTARHAENSKLDGYQIGADDYITKPFNVELLKTRIQNLIQQRKKLRARYSLGLDSIDVLDAEESLDSKFINKLNSIIKDNIANEHLDPSYLASELAMSRMQLYRKVNALTGQTVNSYIKTIRLNRAAQLLLTTDLQIAEIAYKVGYSEPSNFTKNFGKQFNQTPSQFVSANKKLS